MSASLDGHGRRQAAKRAEILDAATEVFMVEGYGRASMEQVHAKIGGSKRTLYSHFSSKEALFSAIVTSVADRVLDTLKPPPDGGDIRTTLVGMGVDYLTVLTSREGLALYRVMVSEALHFPELSKAFFDKGPGRASKHLAVFLADQEHQDALRVKDTSLAAEQFLGMVRGNLHLAAVLGARKATKAQIQKTVLQAVETFLGGIAPELCER